MMYRQIIFHGATGFRFFSCIVTTQILYRSYFKYILTKMVRVKTSCRWVSKCQQICRLHTTNELPVTTVCRLQPFSSPIYGTTDFEF